MQLAVRLPDSWSRYVIEKGSIALDGVSLTVNSCRDEEVSINLIPFTARHTTLKDLRVGDQLNIETDIIGKYVEKLLMRHDGSSAGRITSDMLARHGFI